MSEEIHHDVDGQRFELTIDGQQSVVEYLIAGEKMIFTHTWVPPELRGHGAAARLVQAGMEYARRKKKRVVPQCSYVAVYLQRHPEYADLRAA